MTPVINGVHGTDKLGGTCSKVGKGPLPVRSRVETHVDVVTSHEADRSGRTEGGGFTTLTVTGGRSDTFESQMMNLLDWIFSNVPLTQKKKEYLRHNRKQILVRFLIELSLHGNFLQQSKKLSSSSLLREFAGGHCTTNDKHNITFLDRFRFRLHRT